MKKLLAALAFIAAISPALAQAPVTVIGPITPGHCTVFNSNTVIKDGGFACGAGGPSLVVGTTVISGGTSNGLLFNNAGVLGNLPAGTLTNGIAGTVSLNSGALPAAPTGTVFRAAAANGQPSVITIDSFSAIPNSFLILRSARGTAAAPTALQSGDTLGGLSFVGYGSTGYSNAGRALFGAWVAQNWTDTNQGTYLTFETTPNNSTTRAIVGRIENDGGLMWPPGVTGGSQGLGSINMSSCFVAGVACATTATANVISVSNSDGTLTISPTTGNVVASLNLAHANTWTQPQTFTAGTTGAVLITPTAASNNRGLSTTHSGPSGAQTGPISFNLIDVTAYPGVMSGSTTDNFGLSVNNVVGLRVQMAPTAITGASGIFVASLSAARLGAAGVGGDTVGGAGTSYGATTQSAGGLFGLVGQAIAASGYSSSIASGGPHGIELDVGKNSGATAQRRIGVSIANVDNHFGSVFDAGLLLGSTTAGGEWANVIYISKAIYGQFPTKSTTNFLAADTAATPINHILDLSNFTIGGNIINSANVTLTGAGVATFAGSPLTVQAASAGAALIQSQTNSTTGVVGIDVSTIGSASGLAVLANTASHTGTYFGITRGNYAAVVSYGASSNGILFGTLTSDPLAIGTNDTYRGGIEAGGLWKIGPNVASNSGVLLTINGNTVAPQPGEFSGVIMQLQGADGTSTRKTIDSYGTGVNSTQSFRRGRGSALVPQAVQLGDFLGAFFWQGHDGTGYDTTDAAAVAGQAAENFSTTAHGTDVTVRTIPKTTLNSRLNTTFWAAGGVGIGSTATDPGANNLQVVGTITGGSTINAVTGFQINAAAASGNVLRGNGTNFVSATLAQTDVSNMARGAYRITGVNFNSANTDNAVTITLPSYATRYLVQAARISNCSATATTATAGLFTSTGGGGTSIAANQAVTVSTASVDTANNAMALTLTGTNTTAYNDATLQFRVGTAQGSAVTCDVIVEIAPLT